MFGKKNELKMLYYDGLTGFSQDSECVITYDQESMSINQKKYKAFATLNIKQIVSIDFMDEKFFMQKHKGNAAVTKILGQGKYFLIINYLSSANENKEIYLWHWLMGVDNSGIRRLKKHIIENTPQKTQQL